MDTSSYMAGYREGWLDAQAYNTMRVDVAGTGGLDFTPAAQPLRDVAKPKRKVSAYHKRLGREIKRLRRMHLTKAGKWKKGWNQKRLMKTAHKNTK